jgi:small-conductance mechanosensitive channel
MHDLSTWIRDLWAIEMVRAGLRALLIVVAGVGVTRVVNRRLKLWSLHAQHRLIVRRLSTGLILVISAVWAISTLGLDIGVVLGTAGVLTVAVGFAAQTSFSNLISGIFLMAEQPFRVGDVIKVGDTAGEVLSIDLLSVKLCTFDNLQVRIPNETMLKANVVNQTRFAIRRHDVKLAVAYQDDLGRLREILLGVAEQNPLCLRNPKPAFQILGFGATTIEIQLSVWAARQSLFELRTELAIAIQRALAAHGVELPVPQRTLELGDVGARARAYLGRADDLERAAGAGARPRAKAKDKDDDKDRA